MNSPYKIEISVGGRWIEIGDDHDREYVCRRVEYTYDHLDHFAELLTKCGWSGAPLGQIRLRHADTGEILSRDQCFSERIRLEDLARR